MDRSITHIGSGRPHYGRGRKSLVHGPWTRTQLAMALAFLVFVALTVTAGMYFGWLSSQGGEEQSSPPETQASPPKN